MQDRLFTVPHQDWHAPAPDNAGELASALEDGKVLYFPTLPFTLQADELRFLSPSWADGKAKNISYDGSLDKLKGAQGEPADLAALQAMVARFREHALSLVTTLFPHYADTLRVAQTSFRPMQVEGRPSSWRKDDSRLHVDAFPSRPNQGERILRVFSNVNPAGEARQWRVGQRFEEVAQRYLPQIKRPLPGSAALLHALHITKSPRSEYDHIMLQLHDRMKADADYQAHAPQLAVGFPPGSSWVCYSDQTPHAAMAGQYMFEQTLHLPVEGLYTPASAPLRVLERLTGRALI